MTVSIDPPPASRTRSAVINTWAAVAAVAILVVALAAWLAYRSGEQRVARGVAVHGVAYVGDHQANLRAGGQIYTIGPGVPWIDHHGLSHDAGRPGCLDRVGSNVPVTITAVHIDVNGVDPNPVVLVRCP